MRVSGSVSIRGVTSNCSVHILDLSLIRLDSPYLMRNVENQQMAILDCLNKIWNGPKVFRKLDSGEIPEFVSTLLDFFVVFFGNILDILMVFVDDLG